MPIDLRRLPDRIGLPRTDFALAALLVLAGILWAVAIGSGQGDAPAPVQLGLPGLSRPTAGTRVDIPEIPEIPAAPGLPDGPGGEMRPPIMPWEFGPHEDDGGFSEGMLLVNVIAALAVAVRRRWPLTGFAVAAGAVFVIQDGLLWPGFLAILICAYSAVAYGRSVRRAGALLAVAAVVSATLFAQSIPQMPGWASPFAVLLPAGLFAAALRSARDRADAAARRAAALEQEQAATARAAMAEERARIARELHDVVSHHVSVMVVQAGAAGKVIERRPDLAAGALSAIEDSGRAAMAELRHLLGLMAPVDDRLHPQPGLRELDTLVDAVRAAGQPVTLRRDRADVPEGIDLTAYRVVQEGLTNALRHAPGAHTAVDIRRDGDDLLVEVSNEVPTAEPGGPGAGRGLLGLRERLRLHHGSLQAGAAPGGGFRLTARIPAAS
ncbi:sensor histidine kinase [Catellatospora tritici]|uniref:sensor histidine kinase n=1 Tax=Catellatospora tritici TaxID=2851566 RepID=UPI001C2DCE74|nr:histidine kinase [Catellatospora tritici]MBV1850591.1 sensor histidine kinase [Catellatospora tritici]